MADDAAAARPYDREILRLAVPAFGALAAEPLYVLADTAIVGHLGTHTLAGLAVAGIVLTTAFGLCNFLAYSTTAAVARLVGARNPRAAAEQGIDGLWLALGLGVALSAIGSIAAPAIVHTMGASGAVVPFAITYLRISAWGAPAALLALAATGYLRGLQDTRTTLAVAVSANVLNLALELAFVYGWHLGIAGSAWGTVIAQWTAAFVFVGIAGGYAARAGARLRARRAGVRSAAIVGSQLAVRTGALLATFVATTTVAARIGDRAVAAHQIGFQIWLFLAYALDAIAIAGQAMTGKLLGAGSLPEARAAARRMLEWGAACAIGLGILMAALAPWIAPIFTDDQHVRHLAVQVLWIVALLQPVNAIVFVLDGILIGAGDARYLAFAMLVASGAVFAPAIAVVGLTGGGLLWLWAALCAFMAARLVGNLARFRAGAWQIAGAAR